MNLLRVGRTAIVKNFNEDWLPIGDRAQVARSSRTKMLGRRRSICVMIVEPNTKLPIICSKAPRVLPRSSFHDPTCLTVWPITSDNTKRKAVASYHVINIRYNTSWKYHAPCFQTNSRYHSGL